MAKRSAYGLSAEEANKLQITCGKGHTGKWGPLTQGRKHRSRYCLKCSDERARLKNYGVSKELYEHMISVQSGLCAICERPEKLNIDHNHVTGAVRGLLCRKCNTMLVAALESPLFKAAKKYLKSYSGEM